MAEETGRNVWERLGVVRVVNASGRMTALGTSTLAPAVLDAMTVAAQSYVDLSDLRERAGRRLAELCGAEDGVPTAGAAAGVAIMTAAVVAGTDPGRVASLPLADWEPRGILLEAGHQVHFGAPIVQMIRLGGGRPTIAGSVNRVTRTDVRAAARGSVAGALFVQSHHAAAKGMLPLESFIEEAHGLGLPVLVDAAAEEDLRTYVAMGADLVTYSGGKASEGPTSGFIVGRAGLIRACRAQEEGIARAMKIGKESIAGLVEAVERFAATDEATRRARMASRIAALEAALAGIPELLLAREADEAGRSIERLSVRVRVGSGFDVRALVHDLAEGEPRILTRNHHLDEGWILIDPRPLSEDDVPVVASRIREAVAGRTGKGPGHD